jgi:hypothetical protein
MSQSGESANFWIDPHIPALFRIASTKSTWAQY